MASQRLTNANPATSWRTWTMLTQSLYNPWLWGCNHFPAPSKFCKVPASIFHKWTFFEGLMLTRMSVLWSSDWLHDWQVHRWESLNVCHLPWMSNQALRWQNKTLIFYFSLAHCQPEGWHRFLFGLKPSGVQDSAEETGIFPSPWTWHCPDTKTQFVKMSFLQLFGWSSST